jgi:hypothetical protein
MARNYRAQDQRQEAWKVLLESASLFARTHSVRDEAVVHGELARLALSIGQRSDVDFHANQAITLFQRVGATAEAAAIQRDIAERKTGWRILIGAVVVLCVVVVVLLVLLRES